MENFSQIKDSELPDVLFDIIRERPERCVYALIDGTANDVMLSHFFQTAPDAAYYPLFLGTDLEDCIPRSPYLVQIRSKHLDFIHYCCDEPAPIWFTSPLPIAQQPDFWKSRLYVELTDGRQPLFRYWSAGILEPFISTLEQSQARQFLAPVEHLITRLSGQRCWHSRHIQTGTTTHATPGSWQLTEPHLQAFQTHFSRILAREMENSLWDRIPELLSRIHPILIPHKIQNGLNKGTELGLNRDAALSRFIECQLRWGENFWEQDGFQGLWCRSGSDNDFLERLEQIR
ncbi:MAG: DUF4123 domain-containing protein [Pseudomonadota bacterium]|nr:DUF4123 domain-containing protein [Pseudomonadota bacterium]